MPVEIRTAKPSIVSGPAAEMSGVTRFLIELTITV